MKLLHKTDMMSFCCFSNNNNKILTNYRVFCYIFGMVSLLRSWNSFVKLDTVWVICRDGVLEATALASRRLEASWHVLGLGLGSQVLGLEPKVLGLGPETVLALLVFKQILCKVLRCSSASVNEHNMYGFCFRSVALQIHGKLSCRKPALVSCTTCWRKCSARQQH